jgi:2-polyprenyl-6-methoxyphenol hydroxylase-like FAD-dependent oxidoreductase
MSTPTTLSFSRKLPVGEAYDLAVCGGGPSGVAAALAAARQGLKVLLLEGSGQLGGIGTNGGAARLLGGRTPNNRQWAVKGIFLELVERLAASGGAIHPERMTAEQYNPYGGTGFITSTGYGVPFDPIAMVALLDELMVEASVEVLFFTSVIAVRTVARHITELIVHNKSGLQAIPVKAVVDATGDADVAARSGCRFVQGRAEDGQTTPATLLFHVDKVWPEALRSEVYAHHSPRLQHLVRELREQGLWPFPFELVAHVQLTQPDTLLINATRLLHVDGTDGRAVSRAMMEGRREVQQMFKVMKEHFPGFSEARIRSVATMLGVPESRRIVGSLVYTVDDVIHGREFPDTIGFSAYTWDLPDPDHPDHQPMADRKVLRRHSYTPIPYRIMVPQPIENLVCPGRAVSVEREVLGIVRVQAPCYAMGQAAGTAAVSVVRKGVSFAQVNARQLRRTLAKAGALVDWPAAQL